jgi:hypothetical protein
MPEMVVITDEDESASGISYRFLVANGIKLHGFAMQSTNRALTKVAMATGGVAVNNF